MIAHHVTAVNYIYRNTKFDGRIEHRNIRFEVIYILQVSRRYVNNLFNNSIFLSSLVSSLIWLLLSLNTNKKQVQRIKIDDDSACKPSYNGPHNAFCNEHMDVSNFLNLHSLEDHGDFCLAYVFTYR